MIAARGRPPKQLARRGVDHVERAGCRDKLPVDEGAIEHASDVEEFCAPPQELRGAGAAVLQPHGRHDDVSLNGPQAANGCHVWRWWAVARRVSVSGRRTANCQ